MERQSESVRFLEVRHPHSRTTLEMGAPSDERWTEVPFVGSDDETAMEPRRHGGGRTGRWIAAGVAVGAILLVLVAALALTDPARTRGAAPENDASPQTRATSAANAGHAATLGPWPFWVTSASEQLRPGADEVAITTDTSSAAL